MRIELSKHDKVMLLRAVNDGSIEAYELKKLLNDKSINPDYTKDELEKELSRLYKLEYPRTCERLRKAGLCHLQND